MVSLVQPASPAGMLTLAQGLLARAGGPLCQEGAKAVEALRRRAREGSLDPERAAEEACRLARRLLREGSDAR